MRTLLLATALVSAIATPALANDPSLESCVKYAEADSEFKVATEEAGERAYNERNAIGSRISAGEAEARAAYRDVERPASAIRYKAIPPIEEKYNAARYALKTEKRKAIALLPDREQLYGDKREQLEKHFNAKLRKLNDAEGKEIRAVKDVYYDTRDQALKERDTKIQALRKKYIRANKEIDDAYKAAIAKPEETRRKIYEEAYEGPHSDNPEIMEKLRLRHRERCKALYDM